MWRRVGHRGVRMSARSVLGRAAAVLALVTGAVLGVPAGPAAAAPPSPVYAPSGEVADPGVVRTDGRFYVFATGPFAPVFRGDEAAGPWTALPNALASPLPGWVTSNGIWAPDAVQTPAGWVLYFSAVAAGMN